MSDARIVVSRSAADFAETGARVVATILRACLAESKSATVALAGGSTPLPVYRALARRELDEIDWSRVHFFYGDERAVPPSDPASNSLLVGEALGRLAEAARVHRIPGELGADAGAVAYEKELLDCFGSHVPRFDLVLLGVGRDGHTASLFAGSRAAGGTRVTPRGYVEATRSPEPPRDRISLTMRVLNAASHVVFLARGRDKAEVVARILGAELELPAARVAPAAGQLVWVLDPAAASLVEQMEDGDDARVIGKYGRR